jgi:hypothetical protein
LGRKSSRWWKKVKPLFVSIDVFYVAEKKVFCLISISLAETETKGLSVE